MSDSTPIWFLRAGRKRRAQGVVVETANGMTKVRPAAKRWRNLWITAQEIAAAVKTEQSNLKLK